MPSTARSIRHLFLVPKAAEVPMNLWSQQIVEATLGADVIKVIPELSRLTELEVGVPRLREPKRAD